MTDANLNDAEWRDLCNCPTRFERVIFWCVVTFMCACTLAVVVGVACYVAGKFSN